MTRLIVLCERPSHLGDAEVLAWFQRATAHLAAADAIGKVRLTVLESASARWPRKWDWLIEVELVDGPKGQRPLSDPPWGGLLADLRLLGMRPCVALADSAHASEVAPGT